MLSAGYQNIWYGAGHRRGIMTTAVTISERAARRIGEILKTEGDGAMLRISVEGGGCSGFQYKFARQRGGAGRPGLGAISGRIRGGFRRRPDRRVIPGGQPERDSVLRLRHQLFDLRDFYS
jgi:hypothetical protein